MNPIAFRRGMARDFVRWRMCGRGQGTGDRLWQDKNRKVRTDGSMRNSTKFRLVANIANVSRTLPFSTTHYRTTTFDTLRSNR